MRRAWKTILVIVVVAVALGGLGIGVGLITGADMERIYSVLDNRYNVGMYWQYAQDVVAAISQSL